MRRRRRRWKPICASTILNSARCLTRGLAGAKDNLNVVFYESGKLVLQGKGTPEFIEFVLEPEILKEARLGV